MEYGVHKQAPKAFYGQSAKWGDGAIYNGDWPRNFIRIGGPLTPALSAGGERGSETSFLRRRVAGAE